MSCKQCDVLAADHDAEVKRLGADCEEMSASYLKRYREVAALQERLAAADALLRDAPTGQGAYMLEWRRKREVHLSQSPASEAPTARCWMPGVGAMCYRYQLGGANCTTACAEPTPSQPEPDVTAQLASIERRLRLEIENRQALETGLERLEVRVTALAECLDMNGLRGVPKPVPEPPLVTDHVFRPGPGLDVCWHPVGFLHNACGLPESRHKVSK